MTGIQTESERIPAGVQADSVGIPVRASQSTENRGQGCGYASHLPSPSARATRRPVDNRPQHTTMRCEEDQIVHAPGITNPRWPLCHEAVARTELGWSDDDIADGELSCCWDLLVATIDTDHEATCDACREWVHA